MSLQYVDVYGLGIYGLGIRMLSTPNSGTGLCMGINSTCSMPDYTKLVSSWFVQELLQIITIHVGYMW